MAFLLFETAQKSAGGLLEVLRFSKALQLTRFFETLFYAGQPRERVESHYRQVGWLSNVLPKGTLPMFGLLERDLILAEVTDCE